jgi:hypothetical protein
MKEGRQEGRRNNMKKELHEGGAIYRKKGKERRRKGEGRKEKRGKERKKEGKEGTIGSIGRNEERKGNRKTGMNYTEEGMKEPFPRPAPQGTARVRGVRYERRFARGPPCSCPVQVAGGSPGSEMKR